MVFGHRKLTLKVRRISLILSFPGLSKLIKLIVLGTSPHVPKRSGGPDRLQRATLLQTLLSLLKLV